MCSVKSLAGCASSRTREFFFFFPHPPPSPSISPSLPFPLVLGPLVGHISRNAASFSVSTLGWRGILLANCRYKSPRGGGHHNTSPSSPPGEREEESPQRRRALFEYPRRRHSASISPRTTEAPLALAAPPKRVSYEPAYQPAGSGDRRDNGPAPPPSSWQQRPAGQLPLPRLSDDIFRQQQRRRNDPYAADTRHQQEMPRRPDARV